MRSKLIEIKAIRVGFFYDNYTYGVDDSLSCLLTSGFIVFHRSLSLINPGAPRPGFFLFCENISFQERSTQAMLPLLGYVTDALEPCSAE
jgi:hypothetical protein